MSFHRVGVFLACLGAVSLGSLPAAAETLTSALISTYANNPTLNAARAGQRATDEGVPQALSLYRPTIVANASAGLSSTRSFNGTTTSTTQLAPRAVSVTLTQPIFRGFRSVNTLRRAESSVLLGRETLRNTEQNVLLQAVEAYMNVVRDQAIVGFTQQNLDFLDAQVKASQDRLDVGEGTRTDVAQANASRALAVSTFNTAKANLAASMAVYQQVIGNKPRNLVSAPPVDHLLPASLDAATSKALAGHPAILAARLNVDVAAFNVKLIEGELLPSVSIEGNVAHSDESGGPGNWANSASVVGRLSVPIYDGGAIASRVRQAKEQLDQIRINVDVSIDSIRALTMTDFALLDSARASVAAAQAGINASQLALEGVVEERKVGQRTTLDVLNSQALLLNARISFAQAQRNRVVTTYAMLSAIGGLTAEGLRLAVKPYKAEDHYGAVRNKWHGLRTPDGR